MAIKLAHTCEAGALPAHAAYRAMRACQADLDARVADFRSVVAILLEDWMSVEASRVLPKVPTQHLPPLRAA